MSSLTKFLDWAERRAKPVLKATYRRPAIESARAWRGLLSSTRVIGVTGSAGKTTTKELIYAALAAHARCTKSSDSNNQLYDAARLLLRSGPWTQFCVQELGATSPGKFDPMISLLKPQIGVVTNIATDHLKAFGTREAVAAEKQKLVSCLPADGIAVLNADDPLVAAMAMHSRARIVTYGFNADAHFHAEMVADRWPNRLTLKIHHGSNSMLAQTRHLTGYQAYNVLAAVATTCSLGVSLELAVRAVSRHEPMLGRMSVHTTSRGATVIRDDWKAPDWSILKALKYMADAQAVRKIIVIGTISDGGGRANLYRNAVVAAAAAADHVLLVGARASAASRRLIAAGGGKLLVFDTAREAAAWLNDSLRADDLLMLKGSNNADHLARLALSLDQHVGCWRSQCPRVVICDRCRLVGTAAAP